jgi:hypothetical protein
MRGLSGESRANTSDSVSVNDCASAAAGMRATAIAASTIKLRMDIFPLPARVGLQALGYWLLITGYLLRASSYQLRVVAHDQ